MADPPPSSFNLTLTPNTSSSSTSTSTSKKKKKVSSAFNTSSSSSSSKKKVDLASYAKQKQEALKKKDEVLVIPLIKENQWKDIDEETLKTIVGPPSASTTTNNNNHNSNNSHDDDASSMSIEQMAIASLLEAAKNQDTPTDQDTEGRKTPPPILAQNRNPLIRKLEEQRRQASKSNNTSGGGGGGMSEQEAEDLKFKIDMMARPDQASLEAYEAVPVSSFGEALMRGMGWKPGQGVGGSKMVQAVEFVPRPNRAGLGASISEVDAPPSHYKSKDGRTKKRIVKQGESRESQKVMVLPTGPDGKQRHVRSLDEKLIQAKPSQLGEGVLVEITRGKHKDLWGRIYLLTGVDSAEVTLKNGTQVKVKRKDLYILHEDQLRHDGHPYFAKKDSSSSTPSTPPTTTTSTSTSTSASASSSSSHAKRDDRYRGSSHHRDRDRRSSKSHNSKRSRSRSRSRSPKHSSKKHKSSSSSSSSKRSRQWITNDIRIRFIDKRFQDARFYTKKGVIMDVVDMDHCVISIADENGKQVMLENIKQSQLETALPKPGGKVKVIKRKSPFNAQIGTLLERNSKKGIATVQLDQDFNVETFSYDDVAEFVPGMH
eukprot:TRINITY_DN2597_c3_g1_i2.p1 TRINITY_DN2597_c3_g1~~TRINITY_DN2597_c3_g1_i2.p1  ORF type:complete len:611 (+),score=216.50 TRINITY_DN2597_c3_g1_i2:38-1834(+)